MPAQNETPQQACERADRTLILEALAHLRYREHEYTPVCPACFLVEKILADNGLARDRRPM